MKFPIVLALSLGLVFPTSLLSGNPVPSTIEKSDPGKQNASMVMIVMVGIVAITSVYVAIKISERQVTQGDVVDVYLQRSTDNVNWIDIHGPVRVYFQTDADQVQIFRDSQYTGYKPNDSAFYRARVVKVLN